MKTKELIVFRTFSIEVPTKKLVSEIHILADELILKHFPEYATDGYNTFDELLKATAIKEAIYKLIADKMNLKINQ